MLILGNNKLSENKEKTERRDESEFFYVYTVERKSRYVTLQWSQNFWTSNRGPQYGRKKPENIDIYSGTKREPILFFYGWTMLMAVTAKKDC